MAGDPLTQTQSLAPAVLPVPSPSCCCCWGHGALFFCHEERLFAYAYLLYFFFFIPNIVPPPRLLLLPPSHPIPPHTFLRDDKESTKSDIPSPSPCIKAEQGIKVGASKVETKPVKDAGRKVGCGNKGSNTTVTAFLLTRHEDPVTSRFQGGPLSKSFLGHPDDISQPL